MRVDLDQTFEETPLYDARCWSNLFLEQGIIFSMISFIIPLNIRPAMNCQNVEFFPADLIQLILAISE